VGHGIPVVKYDTDTHRGRPQAIIIRRLCSQTTTSFLLDYIAGWSFNSSIIGLAIVIIVVIVVIL